MSETPEDPTWKLGMELHARLRKTVQDFLEESFKAGAIDDSAENLQAVLGATYMLVIDALAVYGIVMNRNPMKLLDELRPGTAELLQSNIKRIMEQLQAIKSKADGNLKGIDAWARTTVPAPGSKMVH